MDSIEKVDSNDRINQQISLISPCNNDEGEAKADGTSEMKLDEDGDIALENATRFTPTDEADAVSDVIAEFMALRQATEQARGPDRSSISPDKGKDIAAPLEISEDTAIRQKAEQAEKRDLSSIVTAKRKDIETSLVISEGMAVCQEAESQDLSSIVPAKGKDIAGPLELPEDAAVRKESEQAEDRYLSSIVPAKRKDIETSLVISEGMAVYQEAESQDLSSIVPAKGKDIAGPLELPEDAAVRKESEQAEDRYLSSIVPAKRKDIETSLVISEGMAVCQEAESQDLSSIVPAKGKDIVGPLEIPEDAAVRKESEQAEDRYLSSIVPAKRNDIETSLVISEGMAVCQEAESQDLSSIVPAKGKDIAGPLEIPEDAAVRKESEQAEDRYLSSIVPAKHKDIETSLVISEGMAVCQEAESQDLSSIVPVKGKDIPAPLEKPQPVTETPSQPSAEPVSVQCVPNVQTVATREVKLRIPGKAILVENVGRGESLPDVDAEILEPFVAGVRKPSLSGLLQLSDSSDLLGETTTDSRHGSEHTVVGIVTGEPPSVQLLHLQGSELSDTDTETLEPHVDDLLSSVQKSLNTSRRSVEGDNAPTSTVNRMWHELPTTHRVSTTPRENASSPHDKSAGTKLDDSDGSLKQTATGERHTPAELKNKEIAERFKQIMIMFDDFTQSLESLPVVHATTPEEVRSPVPVRRAPRASTSREFVPLDMCPRVHRSRYDSYILGMAKRNSANSVPVAENMPSQPQRRQFARSPPPLEDIFAPLPPPPASKEMATSISGIYLRQERDRVRDLSVLSSGETTSTLERSSASQFVELELRVHDLAQVSETIAAPEMRTVVINPVPTTHSLPSLQIQHSGGDATKGGATNPIRGDDDAKDLSVSGAAIRDFSPTVHVPCERTYHTIHIEATSTPSSSVLHRPPLGLRLWNVLTDFCAAICLCLQVNKDCIFCLGFFIAFVVSVSFLTAFFYRTLSLNTQLYPQPRQVLIESPTEKENGVFYL